MTRFALEKRSQLDALRMGRRYVRHLSAEPLVVHFRSVLILELGSDPAHNATGNFYYTA
jgi:hypothetical protein